MRALVVVVAVSLLTTTLGVVFPTIASAAQTVLFANTFKNNTMAGGTGTVTKPSSASTNLACLSAGGNTVTGPLLSCSSDTDTAGNGTLRLTPQEYSEMGGVYGATTLPMANGLDVTFNSYQYSGNGGAGIAFMLAAVDPVNPVVPASLGGQRDSLGYTLSSNANGVPNGYLGLGLDRKGGFSDTDSTGSGCTNPANIDSDVPNAAVVRGPGNGTTGYCGLNTTAGTSLSLQSFTRSTSRVATQVLVNPTAALLTSSTGLTVAAGSYKITVTPDGDPTRTLTGPLPTVAAGLYPSSTWLTAAGVPKQVAFGFAATTNFFDRDVHEVSDVSIRSLTSAPALTVATTSYAAATSQPGAPVTYTVAAGVQTGDNVTAPISVTQTVPTGVKPLGAYGTGWVCAAPSGQTITCTTSGSSFTNGTTLPVLTVVAIVTAANVAATTVQSSSPTTATSTGATSATDTTAAGGTLPATPSGITLTPATGPLGGGTSVTVGGTNITNATAIEIGTTAEQQAGTPVTLLPCPGAAAAGCFTVSGSTLVISSMPARATAGTVSVTVVTYGVAAAANYVYYAAPTVTSVTPATGPASGGGVVTVAGTGLTTATSIKVGTAAEQTAGTARTLPACVTTGLTSWYTLGEIGGTTAADRSVSNRPATLINTNGGTFTGGEGLSLPGADNAYLDLPDNLMTGMSAITVSLDVKMNTVQNDPYFIYGLGNISNNAGNGYLFTKGNPYRTAITLGAPQVEQNTDSGVNLARGVWKHLTYTQTAAGVGTLFLDGVQVATRTGITVTPGQIGGGVTVDNRLGESLFINDWPLRGQLRDFRIYNRALTAAEVTTNAASTTGCFTVSGNNLVISSMPARATAGAVLVTAVTPEGSASGNYSYFLDKPATPATPTATAGASRATVTWVAPAANAGAITNYVITPYRAGVAQAPQTFDASTTSRTLTGLAPGVAYTFTVAAVNSYGSSPPSAQSAAVTPYTVPAAPTITAATAGTTAATLTWTAPADGGSAITGYVVTPYIGAVAQPTRTFGTGTTQTVTGLTAGTAYTFRVAAVNAAGTGPQSADSTAVTPNASPTLTFAAPPEGQVAVPYSHQLTVTGGTSPFTWALSSGTLPGGLTLSAAGLLSGTPTTAGSSTFVVRVTDASGATTTKSVTLVIRAAPAITFAPAQGEVGVAYSQQPTVSGGSAPFTWAVSAGAVPAGLTLNPSTGLLSGTPTTAGTNSLTITATDSLGQVASRTVSVVIAARPTLSATPPVRGVEGAAYSDTTAFAVSGGVAPFSWAVTAGSLPSGLTLNTSTGALTGTPATAGSYPFTVTVTDAFAQTAVKSVTLVVDTGPLVVVKTANTTSAVAGSTVNYTITFTNSGTSTWTARSLTDPLTGVLDDATYNNNAVASSGTVSYASSTLSWTGNLAPSAVVTITYSVTVANPVTGNKVLANTVSSSTPGSNCGSASTDTRCTATVTVPGLTIVKTADVATTTPGSTVRFSIAITNTGQTPYPAATFTDGLAGVLDDATYNGDATATSGSLSYSAPSLTWTGALAVGASATISYTVLVAQPTTGNRSLSGTVVSSSAGSPCPSGNPAAQCTATVTVLVPALSITNAASTATTTPGSTVTYTVTLANTGQTAYTGITASAALAGVLDDATYNNDATATSGSILLNPATGTLTWSGSIAVGASVTIVGSVTVLNPDPGNKILTSVASSSVPGSTCPPGSGNSACTATTQVLIPALTVATSANVSTTTPGSVVGYTVTATNSGQTPYAGATFSAALAGVLDDATYNNNATATAGAVSVTGSTLTWTGDLAIAASATITYSVTAKSPATGDRTMTTAVTSTTAGSTCPVDGSAPACSNTVTVLIPALRITETEDTGTGTTTPGSVVRYQTTVENTGETTYTAVAVLIDVSGMFDDTTYNNDSTISTGTQVVNGGTVTWTLDLAPGATATSTASFTVKDPPTGNRLLVTSATSTAAGSTCPSAASAGCATSVAVLVPALTITKTASTSTVVTGGAVGYTITVLNSGETTYPAATFTDDLTRVLTDATYAGGATATTGTVSYAAPTLSWTGALAPGATATITYSVTVRDPAPGDKRLINTAVSDAAGSNCKATSTDPRCTATVSVLVPGLTITATAGTPTTAPGATVAHTVVVTNSGTTPFVGAGFADSLTGVLDDAVYNNDAAATAGTVGYAGSTLTWTGDLAVGATATITYSVTVRAADLGDDLVTSSVTSATRGNNCLSPATDPRCTTTVPVARLVLALIPDRTTTTPGSILTVDSVYQNTGQVPYTGISVDTGGQDMVDDATPNGDQVVSSGQLVFTPTRVYWTGDIPVGATINITGSLTVLDPDTGNKLIKASVYSSAAGSNCVANSTDPACGFEVTVLVPALTITKTADTTSTVPGGTVAYTITASNNGQTPYTGATLTDSLSGVLTNATYNGNAAATTGTATVSSSTLSWTGDLAVGATATITYSVTVQATPTGTLALFNSVSSSAVGSTCPAGSGNTACRTSVDILIPGLTLVKTADHANATLGTTVVYTVTATNTGQTSYPAATFSDPLAGVLDDATYDAGATTASSGTTGYTDGVLSWTGALSPGASATVTYTMTIGNPSTGDRSMTNTVTSTTTGSNCASGSTDGRCTATVSVTNSVSLTFTKTADVATTVPGGVVGYTVKVTNSSASAVDADFADPLGGVLDDATYAGGATASSGTVAYTAPDLTWTGTVPAESTVTITYSVTVNAAITGDQLLTNAVSSTSLPESNNCAAASTDPRCTTTVPIARLQLTQTPGAPTATPGSIVSLTATYTNTGKVPYTGISIASPRADTSDDTIPTGDQTATSGTLVRTASAITWTGDIPVGATITVLRTLTVKNPDPGNKLITATLSSTAPGNNCPPAGTDPTCTFLVTVLVPGLTLTKAASATATVPGATVGYTITVQNTGETSYTGATFSDPLTGLLDDATYDGNATATTGTLNYTAPTLSWTGNLAVGATATITYSVTTLSPQTGDKTMVNTVSSSTAGSTCPPSSGNTACRTSVVVLTPALTVSSATSTATTVPGATVTYTVTVANTGQTSYPSANVTAALGDVLDNATYGGGVAANSGTATITGSTLSWTGSLAPGASATITYAVVVTATQLPGADYRLDQTVVSTDTGSTCPTAGAEPACTTTVPIAALRSVSTTNVSETQPTGVVVNTTTFTNIGQVPYVGITIDASFVGSLDDATYNGDATTTAGTLILLTGTGVIRWTGDLAVGATSTVTGSLTVNNPDLGNKVMTTRVSTATAGSNCPPGSTDPACLTSVQVLTPALTLTKTANASTTTPGSTVTYTVTVTNSGQTAYPAATVSDALGGVLDDGTYTGVGATTSSGTLAYTEPTLTWSGSLAVGQVVTITYDIVVDGVDLGDRSLVNTVQSDAIGSTCTAAASGPACTSRVTVLVPALDISLTADRSTTVPGGVVGYTVTLHNTGQTPYTGTTVTTALAGVLDDAGVTGTPTATAGTVAPLAPTDTTLVWTGDLAVDATAIVTFGVTVTDPDAGDKVLLASVSSAAAGSTCGAAAQCSSSVTVLIPGLAVSTTVDTDRPGDATTTPGSRVVYTITAANTGQTPYTSTAVGTSLTGVLDDATFDGVITASTGVATYTAPDVSWTGSLQPGETVTITYAVLVRDPDPGNKSLTSTVVAPAAGSTCQADSTDPACTVTVTVLVPGLSIVKSAGAATTTPGSVVDYTIVVTNTGQTNYTGAVVSDSLTRVLADADYNPTATVSGGGVLGYADSTLTWTGDLLIGASATITYSVTVHDPVTGDRLLVNTVSSTEPGSTCPPGGTGAACSVAVQVLVPALVITKAADRASVTAGDAVQYTVTIANTGETAYAPATVTDPLTGVLDDATYTGGAVASSGTVGYTADTLTWTGPLAIGETATVTYSVTTTFPAVGDRSLVNTALSVSPGSSCRTSDDAGCSTSTVAVLVPALTITKTADAAQAVAGGPLGYTVIATNTGEADYATATLTDSLAGVLDDATYNDDATASTGTVTGTGDTIAWSGRLRMGETVVVSYSVQAKLTGLGDSTLINRVVSTSVGSTCPTGGTDPACATSTAVAARTITLSGLTPSFTLAGLPGSTVGSDGTVTMTVTTNSSSGYQVGVDSASAVLVGSVGNSATIPVDLLEVRESGTEAFRPMSSGSAPPLVVHEQRTPSAPGGDAVSTDYRIEIPDVPSDTYSTTIDYIVSAQ